MKTWHEVMKVAEARALVRPIREGKQLEESPWWQEATQTDAVRVVVVDDGCDVNHAALPATTQRYHFTGTKARPEGASAEAMLNTGSSHGTMSAGMVVGVANTESGFLGGVAADIQGVSFCPARYSPNVDFNADMTMYTRLLSDGARVLSNSFGFEFTGRQLDRLGEKIRDSSAIFLYAAGNSTQELTATDHFAHAILVGASIPGDTLADETKVPKSNYGAGITVCAPGGHAGAQPPTSTVNTGTGAGEKDFDAYGDTSAACAMVAGVVTLMLLADPGLTAIRVKEILALTADKIDPNCTGTGQWKAQARSVLNGNHKAPLSSEVLDRPYSRFYGFGRVNAEAAVKKVLGIQ